MTELTKTTNAPDKNWAIWLEENKLTDLIKFPENVVNQIWDPGDKDKEAAWDLYTELRTRISTQPLHYRSGDEETALNSLYQLFGFTREILKKHGPECRHFATFAVFLLNRHIRPFTAKWHKKQIDGRFSHDDDRRQFREELQRLQAKLLKFTTLLGLLAEGDEYQVGSESGFPEEYKLQDEKLAQEKLEKEIGEQPERAIPFKEILFDASVVNKDRILEKEQRAIKARRQKAGAGDKNDVENLVGLSCSGGGIRSASFCLGVVQRLALAGLLPYVDYLSTVSGGGYFGSFLSSYWNDSDPKVGPIKNQLPFSQGGKPEPDPIRHLRNNSKYLLKGGLLGQARMLGLLLYGIFINLLILMPLILIGVTIAKIIQVIGVDYVNWESGIYWLLGRLVLLLTFLVLVLPFVYRFNRHQKFKERYERTAIILLLGVVVLWVLGIGAPSAYQTLIRWSSWQSVLLAAAALPFVLAGMTFAVGARRGLGRFLMALIGVTGPVFLFVLFLTLNQIIGITPQQDNTEWNIVIAGTLQWTVLGLTVTLSIIYLFLVNINLISPHRYYRNRLAETYLIRRSNNDGIEYVDPQPLSELRKDGPAAPYHLINGALNIPFSKRVNLRGRNTDFFLFSQHYCGSPVVGYCKTEDLENRDSHVNLGTVMAISGAAASSYMGTQSIKGTSFWIALLNLRLGYWVPNPTRINNHKYWLGPGPEYLLRELSGRLHENTKYINISDGGHIENLGLYELLRRKCKYIIAIDGEADPTMSFNGLIKAIRFAQIDFGIRIVIDLEDLKKLPNSYSRTHFALGKTHYNKQQTGLLLYIKSSMTGNERDYIQDYRAQNPTFPHQTTSDQFFDEAQFEAYRALGYHIGEDLFRKELVQKSEGHTMESWFSMLKKNLFEEVL